MKSGYIRCEKTVLSKIECQYRLCVCMESAKEPWFSSDSSISSRQFTCLLQSPGTQFRSCSAKQRAKIRPLVEVRQEAEAEVEEECCRS